MVDACDNVIAIHSFLNRTKIGFYINAINFFGTEILKLGNFL